MHLKINPERQFLICRNIYCLNESNQEKEANSLLKTYHLSHNVNFATEIKIPRVQPLIIFVRIVQV
jgi:hypothetical protein